MTEPKWTEGIWFAEKASDTTETWAIKSDAAPAFFVAEAFILGSRESAEHNARLIGAAPELYTALNNLAAHAAEVCAKNSIGNSELEAALDKAGEALAKARGERP